MLIPPSFYFTGSRERAISLKSKALKFYQFITTQADIGGVAYISRSLPLEDGSLIKITSFKEGNYNLRTGHIVIFGNSFKEEIIKPQFYLYASNYSPYWLHGYRLEEWGSWGTRVAYREDITYAPVPNYTLTKISPQDVISFHFLISEDADILQNPSDYIFIVNNTVYDVFKESSNAITWQHDIAISFRYLRISYGYNKTLREYAKDDNGNELKGFYFAYMFVGLGGIVRPGEEGLISSDYLQFIEGLTSKIKVVKRNIHNVPPFNELTPLGSFSEEVGGITYKTISADPNYLYRSKVDVSKKNKNFFDIYNKGSGISRINNKNNI